MLRPFAVLVAAALGVPPPLRWNRRRALSIESSHAATCADLLPAGSVSRAFPPKRWSRLENVTLKLRKAGATVHIVAFGGSFTMGHECHDARARYVKGGQFGFHGGSIECAWPARLQELLQQGGYEAKVEVHNAAHGAWNTLTWAMENVEQADHFQRADLIVFEGSINDAGLSPKTVQAITWSRDLLRVVLQRAPSDDSGEYHRPVVGPAQPAATPGRAHPRGLHLGARPVGEPLSTRVAVNRRSAPPRSGEHPAPPAASRTVVGKRCRVGRMLGWACASETGCPPAPLPHANLSCPS